MTHPPVLEITDLHVAYRSGQALVPALHGVNLRLEAGECLGIVGESGCGKSTLIAAILQMLAANGVVTAGSIRFMGRDLAQLSARELRALRGEEMAIVFQDPMQAHNPVISIGRQMQDIQYRARLSRAEKRARALEMLHQVEMSHPEMRLTQYPFELSGGMRQRLAIAMAMMARPKLLIADEPTTALDATVERQILDKLREMTGAAGTSVIFISHHLGAVARLCRQIMVMYRGHVVEAGDLAQVFAAPQHPYTRALMACDPAAARERLAVLPTITAEMREGFLP